MNNEILPESVLIKTRKGLEEVDKRTYKLPGRLRAILFMVDGQRTFADLLEQAGNMSGQLQVQLQELAIMGFIAAVKAESAAEITAAITTTPLAEKPADQSAMISPMATPVVPVGNARGSEDIAVLKTRIGAMLAETLGMRAMMLSTQLESIQSVADLGNFIDDTARSVAVSNGGKIAEQWRTRARAIAGL